MKPIPPRPMKPLTISIAELCAAVGCGKSLAYKYINSGEVKTAKLGRRTVVLYDSVEAMIERHTVDRAS